MKKAHVVQVITQLELGGAQEVTLYTVENLDRDRFDVTLITGIEGLLSPRARKIKDAGLIEIPAMVRSVRPVKDLVAFVRIYRAVRRIVRNSDVPVIVHTHSSKAGILGRWAGRLGGARAVVHSIHGFGFNEYMPQPKRWVFEAAERLTARITDAFTADSRANIDRGLPLGIFRKVRVEVIRSGIDLDYYSSVPLTEDRGELGLPAGGPIVMMVSCLKPQKAPLDFVRVAARVLKEAPDARFVQVGGGELRDDVLAEAGRLGLGGGYTLLGWRDDLRELIHAADVMVLTSLWEGLPLVIPMAMAVGKPFVATDADGNPEAVNDGETGYIVPKHGVEKAAERVLELLRDKGLARGMGEKARNAAGEFDRKYMLERITEMYEELLGEKA